MKKEFLFTILALAVLVATNMLTGHFMEVAGLVIAFAATPGGLYSPDTSAFRENLETKVHRTMIEKSKFGPLTSVFNVKKDPSMDAPEYTHVKGTPSMDSSVVMVVQDFTKKKQGVKVEIPYTSPDTGDPLFGTNPASGKGERAKLFYTYCALNMVRKVALTRDNEMSEQMLDKEIVDTLNKAEPRLKDYFGRYVPFEYYFSLLEGYSRSLTDSGWGLGYTKKSHPNSYVKSVGHVAFNTAYTFDAAFETAMATALANLDAADSTVFFDTQSIRDMVFLANKHKIPQINYGGQMVHLILIHPAQARQLRQDDDWNNAWKQAGPRNTKENAIWTGGLDGIIYEGALVLIDTTLPGARISGDTDTTVYGEAYNSDMGTVHYGMTHYLATPRDITPRKCAVLLGPGGITAATGKKFKFTREVADHEQFEEVAGRMFLGASRPDLIDSDGIDVTAGLFKENTTSLLYWTWSPDSITI